MEEIVELLETKRRELGADGIKVYFLNDDNYCIKFVKNGALIKVVRKGNDRSWDRKKETIKG